jgi:large subunit ribosomal protein L27e
MGKKMVDKRSRVKPFIKVVNYNHLMPTRYTLELEGLKGAVSQDTFKEVSQREEAKKTVKKALEDRYTSGKNRWFFTPLRMSPLPSFPTTLFRLVLTDCRFLNGVLGGVFLFERARFR